jgi:hypothetical protein
MDFQSLQATLDTAFEDMLDNCGALVVVGQGLAGLGALCYVLYRVWGHLARGEEIDMYPLLRHFA